MHDPRHDWWDEDDYLLGLVAEVFGAESPPLQVRDGDRAGRRAVDRCRAPVRACRKVWTRFDMPD